MSSRRLVFFFAFMLMVALGANATVFRMLTGDYTSINPDWSAYENGRSFDTVESGTPSHPLISTQHYAGNYSIQVQVPTDTTSAKERFEYVIAHATEPDGLHFDNARYCGFAFKLGSPTAAFSSSDLFWQAWQGSPWGPPASLKLTAGTGAPYTLGLYIRNMLTGPDSAVPDVRLWSSPVIQPDTWYSVVIYICPRYTNNDGVIKLWFNGTNVVNCTTNIGYDPGVVAGALNGLDIKNGMYQPNANNGHTMYFDQIMFTDTYGEAAAAPLASNTPPMAGAVSATILRNTSFDVNLSTLVHDGETAPTQCLYTVSTTNGNVMLLADGYTSRFLPATNFVGVAGFTYTVTDDAEDPREFLHYSFEPPDLGINGFATDNSGHFRDGNLLSLGSGLFTYSTNTPLTLASSTSLLLTKSGSTNAARLSRYVSNPAEFNLSDRSWTFSGWFRRASTVNHDFIFYIGSGDGFGGNGDELQLYCPGGSSALTISHYNTNDVLDLNALSFSTAGTGEWHHAALIFQRTNVDAGILFAYLDGTCFCSSNVTWSLPQTMPLVFGGHNKTNSNINRWFGGWLDDLVLFTNALSPSEISMLATRSVTKFGGATTGNFVNVTVTNYARPLMRNVVLSNGACSMQVSGDAGGQYMLQASTNLLDWTPLLITNAAVLPFTYIDTNAAGFVERFFRVLIGP